MVDSRSLNAVTPTGSFNFKSGDISGTAAKTADDRQSQGMDYFQQQQQNCLDHNRTIGLKFRRIYHPITFPSTSQGGTNKTILDNEPPSEIVRHHPSLYNAFR